MLRNVRRIEPSSKDSPRNGVVFCVKARLRLELSPEGLDCAWGQQSGSGGELPELPVAPDLFC